MTEVATYEVRNCLEEREADPLQIELAVVSVECCHQATQSYEIVFKHLEQLVKDVVQCGCGAAASEKMLQTVCLIARDLCGGEDKFQHVAWIIGELAIEKMSAQGVSSVPLALVQPTVALAAKQHNKAMAVLSLRL